MDDASIRAKEIFLAALERGEPTVRAAYVEEACGADVLLRERVEALLRAHDESQNPLEKPAAELGPTELRLPEQEQPGMLIGPYKLMEKIGEGGFGLVFVAEQQQPVRRRVALKVIKPGMDTREVIARFEAERQALALMDHPHIARVLDAGTTATGRPYFVMELVRGVPITEYCDQHQLTPRERLELFVTVCQAVQHAHQKGIIHRDLKPTNVLVTLQDGKPFSKVIDFGIAKAVNQQLTERTIYTRFAQLMGTPLYMSPEQAQMSALDIDTRSDIYSLGVLLYELLTGATPFDRKRLSQAAFDEVRRIIREEEPPTPSQRLSRSETLPSVAAQRRMEPARLSRLVRGELDWIVMKALEKDRNRRYETAAGFARDVKHYLDGEPVEASPPSTAYRLRKFTRKHRAMLITAATFFGLLLAAVGVTTWLAVWANRLRDAAISAQDDEREARQHAETERNRAIAAESNARDEARRADKEAQAARSSLYAARINLAHVNWKDGSGGTARAILDACEVERGWEWHYLNRVCRQELRIIAVGQWSIHALDFSSDGSRLVTASHDGQAIVWDVATGKELLALKGHKNPVRHVAYSPDGKRLATASEDHTIRLWDAATGEELAKVFGRESLSLFRALAFDTLGARIATVDGQGAVCIRSAVNLQPLPSMGIPLGDNDLVLEPLSADEPAVNAPRGSGKTVFMPMLLRCAFGNGFDRFAALRSPMARTRPVGWWSPGPNGEIVLGDLSSPDAQLRALHPDPEWTSELTISPDGRWVAASSSGAPLQVWDLSGNEPVRHVFEGPVNGCRVLRFNPASTRLACGDDKGGIRVWQVPEGKLLRLFVGPSSPVLSLAFSRDGSRLASAADDGSARLWDFTPALLRPDKSMLNREIRIGPVANSLFSADSAESDPILWTGETTLGMMFPIVTPRDMAADQSVHILETRHGFERIAFTPDDGCISAISERNGPSAWDAESLLPIERLVSDGPADTQWFDAARRTDGTWVVAKSADNSLDLAIFGKAPGQTSRTFRHVAEGVRDAVLTRDGRRLAALVDNGEFSIWDTESGAEICTFIEPRGSEDSFSPDGVITFSPDGNLLAASYGGQLYVWDVAQGRRIQILADHRTKRCPSLAINADGGIVAVGNANLVRLWNLRSGQELFTLRGHADEVTSLAFSPDGKRLVSGSRDRTVKLWDPLRGNELLTLPGHTGQVNALCFSPDGYRLVSAGADQTLRIYDARPLTADLEKLLEGRGIAEWLVQSSKTRSELAEHIEAQRSVNDQVRQRIRELAPTFWNVEIELRAEELVSRRFERLLLKSDVLASLHDDETLDVEMRRSALEQVGRFDENPYTLNEAAWAIVIRSDAQLDEYAHAARLAEGAVALIPENAAFLTTLGAAQYRADRAADALASLERSQATNSKSGGAPDVADLAFLAMAYHSLGQTHMAQRMLQQLEELAERKLRAGEAVNDKLLVEARKKLAGTEPAPKNRDSSPKRR